MDEQWIPILDYAVLKGVSTSTLRRYIKAQKIPFKLENGRYLIRADAQPKPQRWDAAGLVESVSVFQKTRELEQKLAKAEEQISELKMLVAIYEEKLSQAGH